MGNKRAGVLNLILYLLIFALIIFGAYFIYLNLPGDPINLNPVVSQPGFVENITYSEVSQFYPNMKFNHNSISYSIGSDCSDEKRQRTISAFNDLSSRVGIINFFGVVDNADIYISCSEDKKDSIDKTHFVAGEGGAKEIIPTGRYNVINEGVILLYGDPQRAKKCDWANVELHELIHVFGFGHSEDQKSLMYPYLESCDQKLDDEIINELRRLYSQENLADLYFDNISAIKKGRYLDFNLTIKNSGSINSKETKFSVLDDGELVESFDLSEIKYGAGISIEIKNVKLKSRNPDEIRFIIDKENLVAEIDENNNVAVVSLIE